MLSQHHPSLRGVDGFLPRDLNGCLLYLPQWSGGSYALGAMNAVSSAGTSPPVMTVSGTPNSNVVSLRVEITSTAGGTGLGQAAMRWSVDAGDNWTSNVTTAASVVLTGTGLTLSMSAGPYNTNNVYTATAVLSQNNDVTGNGNPVTASTTARPTLARNASGTKHGVQYDGVANVMSTASSAVNPVAVTCAFTMRVDSFGAASHEAGVACVTNGAWAVTTFNQAGTGKLIMYPPAGGTASGAVATGSFHHYVFTWDGTTGANAVKLYQDNAVFIQATALGANAGANSIFRIGQKTTTAGTFSAITILDVALYNRVLSTPELALLYGYAKATQGF